MMIFDEKIKLFEEKMKNLMDVYKLPGLSIAISHEDKIIYSTGFGFANIKKKVKATQTTPYRIASLTKPIASIVILQLVEKRIIDLDKSIADYIPKYLEICRKNKQLLEKPVDVNGEKINLSHLIEGYNFEQQNITIRHHLQQTIINEPGEEYRYNGLLYGLLGVAVDFQTEEKFQGLLKKNIFEKLGMEDSLPCQEDESKPELLQRLAIPYKLNEKRELAVSDYPQTNGSSSAGIISTVLDYMKFDKALNENTLIAEETKEMAFTNPKTRKGRILPYGLGFFIQTLREYDGKIIWHYGHWPTFSSLYLKRPDQKLTLIMFANSNGLSENFDLGNGDIARSPFAMTFLEIFG